MNALPDAAWQTKLRYRLEDFRATALFGKGSPCSVKIRPCRGHFDRASTPRAYALIDERIRGGLSSRTWLGEHDTGPEILCAFQSEKERLFLPAELGILLREILMAAQLGRNAGDPLDGDIEVLLRGFGEDEAYFERTMMSLDLKDPLTEETVRHALGQIGIDFSPRKNACCVTGKSAPSS